MRNESETRAELIDPKLQESGWGVIDGSKILREFRLTEGKILAGGARGKAEIADYVLVYKNRKLAVIEAKSEEKEATEGVAQAKIYAGKLEIEYTYATNGKGIYEISMKSGKEDYVDRFPMPEELWQRMNSDYNAWREKLAAVPFESVNGTKGARYYQEIAVERAADAVAAGKNRILLTLATGTGKTFVAFQIAWKLFQARWNLRRDGKRIPRILFLADRNILADQAFNAFSAFPEEGLVRINSRDIRKKGSVPTNGSVYFTIFQTFMSGENGAPFYGDYPPDFFDFIIIDECHRGGANDESSWRGILEYFSPAVQLGLTATPKRKDNVDTYRYFGEPIYIYSLKEGINDGFLTPFKVKRIKTTLDDYVYTSDDEVIEGEVEEGRIYKEPDFNRIIKIKEREAKRVRIVLDEIGESEKTIIFCANQDHALAVRDLINQMKKNPDPNYCVRVTANDGAIGDQFLREFQDNEKTIPTILTTSQKLSTGVDARNVRNIVLMRPVNSMIEFKQIIGRGTRIFDGKEYFTILDFVDAYRLFMDPEWDGEPIEEVFEKEPRETKNKPTEVVSDSQPQEPIEKRQVIKIRLRDGKEREIQHMISISFYSADGKPISTEELLKNMFGELSEFFSSEEDLRKVWSDPKTRKKFLEKIAGDGYGKEELEGLQKMIDAQDSDIYDVLAYVAFATPPISRRERVEKAKETIFRDGHNGQAEFLDFVLEKYIEKGFEELGEEKLPKLLRIKYNSVSDAEQALGEAETIRAGFLKMQEKLYQN